MNARHSTSDATRTWRSASLWVHHIARLPPTFPLPLFIGWLHSLNATVILEFIGRDDEMFQKLLDNKAG